jgi:molecular chaperone GrpE
VTETGKQRATMNGEVAAGGNGAAPDAGPVAETETTADEVARLTAERDEFLDQLQRSRAEFANFRRRTEQERAALRQVANQALLVQILPAYDDLQRALAAVPADQRESPLAQGVALIERKFWNALERAGVSPIAAEGEPFDPAQHEAVEMAASGDGAPADTVVAVYQTGYRLGDALLRPAMVKVGPRAESGDGGRESGVETMG